MYIKKTWCAGRTIEIKKCYSARYGRKIPRGVNENETREAQAKVNYRRALGELRRLLNANFHAGDIHAVFTYPMNPPPTPQQAKADREKFIRKLRKLYADHGDDLKYIVVTEYTHKRIHHHMILNEPSFSTKLIKALWKDYLACTYYTDEERARGEPLHLRFPWSVLDDSGQYGELAAYVLKETEKSHREPGASQKRRYSCSRNLVHPVPVVEIIDAKRWRKEAAERKGYYIDKIASRDDVDPFSGLPIQETVYVEITREQRRVRRRC